MSEGRDIASLFKRWRRPVHEWVRKRAINIPSADLDDICQEAFVRLLRYPTEMEFPQSYIFNVVQNVANEWQERARYRKPHLKVHLMAGGFDSDDVVAWMQLLDDSLGPAEAAERESEEARIHAAIAQLTGRQQRIFCMHVFDEMTYKQISTELGVTYRLVLRELTRSYSQLRMELK